MTRSARRRRWPLILLLTILVIAGLPIASIWLTLEFPPERGDIHERRADWPLPALPQSDRSVLLLMIDGLAVASLERALTGGRMPNLSRLMTERPTARLVAVSTFPSATSPAVPELLSGSYVELEGIDAPAAVHAFDRIRRNVIRYVTEPDTWQWPVPTLFDAVGGRRSVTVFEGRWDGPIAILTQYNLVGQAFLEAIGAAAFSGGDRGPVEAYINLLNEDELPTLSLVVFNEFDLAAHFHGPVSAEALDALASIDTLIGEILTAIERRPGGLAGTSVMVFGDHGMTQSGRFVDLAEFFRNRGFATVDVSTVGHVLLRERLGTLWTNWTDVILVAGGSNITQIYLRDEASGWSPPRDPVRRQARLDALADEIAALEGVDQVLLRDADGAVEVVDAASRARVLTRGSGHTRRFAYLVDEAATGDPFGYTGRPATRPLVCRGSARDDCFHSLTEWLDASADSSYPGAVPMLPKAFEPSEFAGDLMVAADVGYTFLQGQHGDHGHLYRDSMLTPLIINGPGVQSCAQPHQPKLVDIFPTAAVLLGAEPDDPAFATLDGRVLDCVAPPPGTSAPGGGLNSVNSPSPVEPSASADAQSRP